jgi:phosphoesterase RecJ-like protein
VTDERLLAVAARIRSERVAAVGVHEQPDLDALGSAVGLLDLLRQCGAAARLHADPGVLLPQASFAPARRDVALGPPPAGATLYAVDTGNLARLALSLGTWRGDVVNIDHHHDNARFGALDLVLPEASSVSEIVCLLARELDVVPSPAAAAALYAGISFDTGHFRHASTRPETFRCAAELVAAGADPYALYAELYEGRTVGQLKLWARAVTAAVPVAAGRALVSVLTQTDFAACRVGPEASEGIVETLRSLRGVDVAALVKEQADGVRCRVSLRSSGWDVSALAAERGGGGHRQAAGFSSDDSPEEVARWLSSVLDGRLSTVSS